MVSVSRKNLGAYQARNLFSDPWSSRRSHAEWLIIILPLVPNAAEIFNKHTSRVTAAEI